jgi:transglutaminase-like putative cysteine protease
VATAAVLFTSYMGLAATDRYENSLLLVPLLALLLMPMAEVCDRRFPSYRKMTWAASFLFALALPLLYRRMDFLVLVIYLVAFIQLYTVFHEKNVKNYNHLILMSFFLLLVSSVMAPTPLIAVAFFLFVVSSVWLLFTLEIYTAYDSGAPAASVEIVDSPERGSGAEAKPFRVFGPRMIFGVGAIATLVLVLTGTLFLSIPRMEAGLFGTPDSSNFRSDLSTDLEIASGMIIQLDTTAVMRVEFPEEPDGRYYGTMYWRASALDHYDYVGHTWTRRGASPPIFRTSAKQRESYRKFSAIDGIVSENGVYRPRLHAGRPVVQDIFLVRAPDSGLPTLPLVRKARAVAGQKSLHLRWSRAQDFTIASGRRTKSGLQYLAESEVFKPTDEQLRYSSADYLDVIDRRTYRHLTRQFLLPETRQLTEEIAADSESAFDQMAAIEAWLSSSRFTYSLNVPQLPESNPIDEFIRGTRTGHCELYASALALMGRSLDIPTRLVNGYRGGAWNDSDGSYTVTADMAHAWVEAYFPDFGWIAFDPSPASSTEPGLSLENIRRRLSQLTLFGKLFWYRNVIGFRPEAGAAFLKGFALSIVGWEQAPNSRQASERTTTPLDHATGALRAVVFLAGAVLMAHTAVRLTRARGRKGRALTRDQARATALYMSFRQRLRKRGIDCRGKTVEELREAIAAEAWIDEPAARSILSSYNTVRFGRRPLDAGPYGALQKKIRSFRGQA